VVDITADQFEDQNRSVIVEIESKWHELFELDDDDKQHPSDFEKYNEAACGSAAERLSSGHPTVVGWWGQQSGSIASVASAKLF
jgi:hypothetical protein